MSNKDSDKNCKSCAFRIHKGCLKKLSYFNSPSGACTGHRPIREKSTFKHGNKPKISGNDSVYAVFHI